MNKETMTGDMFNNNKEMSDEELEAMMIGSDQQDLIDLLERMDSTDAWQHDRIVIPEGLDSLEAYSGPLYGYLREKSGYHSVLGYEDALPRAELETELVGFMAPQKCKERVIKLIQAAKEAGRDFFIIGEYINGKPEFTIYRIAQPEEAADSELPLIMGKALQKDVYTMRQNLFSRSSGLLETSWMDEMCAVISGCGSVGSCVALQLARSGVGRFILCDEDCVEIHNICRHQCNLTDLGRYKVDAVKERILQINPNAEVDVYTRKIQELSAPYGHPDWVTADKAIFIGTCDNRVGNAYACDAAYELGVPFISLGFMDRAWGGEIFTCLPEKHDICYRCAFYTQIAQSIAHERRNHFYIGEEEKEKAHFEPGLDVDIEYGVSILSKAALDILNRKNENYHSRIYHTMSQFTVFSGTDDKSMADPFWKKALPGPLDMRSVLLNDKMRRCEHCYVNS